jgi:hypothetical protein
MRLLRLRLTARFGTSLLFGLALRVAKLFTLPTLTLRIVLPVCTRRGLARSFPGFGLAYNGKDKNVGAFNDAEMAARQRSAGGGATQGSLTDSQQKLRLVGKKQRKLLFNSK